MNLIDIHIHVQKTVLVKRGFRLARGNQGQRLGFHFFCWQQQTEWPIVPQSFFPSILWSVISHFVGRAPASPPSSGKFFSRLCLLASGKPPPVKVNRFTGNRGQQQVCGKHIASCMLPRTTVVQRVLVRLCPVGCKRALKPSGFSLRALKPSGLKAWGPQPAGFEAFGFTDVGLTSA